MKSPLHTLRTLINLHDGKDDGGDGITAGDWAEARAVAAQPFHVGQMVCKAGTPHIGFIRALEPLTAEFMGITHEGYAPDELEPVPTETGKTPAQLAAENARLKQALARAELSTAQIRMAVDIGRTSAARREAWFRSQLAQLGREIREALDAKP